MQRILLVLAGTLTLVGIGLTLLSSGDERVVPKLRAPRAVVLPSVASPRRDLSAAVGAQTEQASEPNVTRVVLDSGPVESSTSSSFTLRALDEYGAPLANASIAITPWTATGLTGVAEHTVAESDARGHFQLTSQPNSPAATTFTCDACGEQRLTGFLSAQALRQFTARLAGDPQDVLFRLPAILVTGQVVDADGLGVDGITVHVGPRAVFDPALPFRTDASAETRGGGYFTIQGDIVREPFTVWCRRGKLLGGPFEATAGTRDLLVELYRTQTTRAKLLVDEGFPLSYGALELWQDGRLVQHDTQAQASSSGLLSASAYGTGFYTLVIRYAGAEVARREEMPVGSAAPVLEFDLRGQLQRHVVRLNLPAGVPLRGAVQWRASGSNDPWFGAVLRSTELNLASPAAAIDLRLQVTGQALVERLNWSGEGSLSLR